MEVLIIICILAFFCKGGDGKKEKKTKKNHSSWYDSLNAGDRAWLYEHYK